MRRTISILVTLIIVGVLGLDIYTWSKTTMRLNETTYDLASTAGRLAAPGATRETVGAAIAQQAAQSGVRVYQYDQTETGVRVWTEADVTGTIVIGGVWNLMNGMEADAAFRTPFVVRDYGEAGIK